MSPIDEFLAKRLTEGLAAQGVQAAVDVVHGEAERWRYRVTADHRVFLTGFSHEERFWCHEATPGHEWSLVSNDEPPVTTAEAARRRAIERIVFALRTPTWVRRDPPVI